MKDLLLFVARFLKSRGKCRHAHALLNSNEGYCPDCGQYLKKYYYVLRCKCCEHKREATRTVFGEANEIVPISKFCPQCGGEEFYVERYEKLNLVDINFAIEVKEAYDPAERDVFDTKVWVEMPDVIVEDVNEASFDFIPPKRITGQNAFLLKLGA